MSDPFIGEIQMFCYTFPPASWAWCNGQSLTQQQNPALYAIIGQIYGGTSGSLVTFNLPNMQGRVPVGVGQGAGLSNYTLGEKTGTEMVTLTSAQMPLHNHVLHGFIPNDPTVQNQTGTPGSTVQVAFAQSGVGPSSASINAYNGADTVNCTLGANSMSAAGSGSAHENRQPFLAVPFCIALQGIFPMRN